MMDRERFNDYVTYITSRQDLVLVAFLVLAIFMMILPLPTALVDALIGLNLSVTVLLLMVGVYLKEPLHFSTLPSVILIATLFRLSLSITTTRLILVDADAGQIVETFGSFVVSGNIIVGMVVFLIITVVQFVVVTKGSERIAEVSARFSLDALPGKQMSIDSDMRAGLVDIHEARRRRRHLEKESQFYGSMDGAMKFVKGDAIAGIIIILVNLIGGISVGTLQNGMTMGEAAAVYTLLTVGDGLVSQIPALFMAITAGTIVTRVTSEDSKNLGADIGSQLVAEPNSLRLAAVVLLFFAFIPGFPTIVFLVLSGTFAAAGIGFWLRDRRLAAESLAALGQLTATEREGGIALGPSAPAAIIISRDIEHLVSRRRFDQGVQELRDTLFERFGVPFPKAQLLVDPNLAADQFRIVIEDIPVADGEFSAENLVVTDDPINLELMDLAFTEGKAMPGLPKPIIVSRGAKLDLERAQASFLEPVDVLVHMLGDSLSRYADRFLGIQETRSLLAAMERDYGDLVSEAIKIVPLQKLAEVLRRLVEEGVSIRNMRIVLEGVIEWGQKEKDVAMLAEYVRGELKRQISHTHANKQHVIPAFLIEQDTETMVRDAIRHTSVGSYLALDNDVSQRLLDKIRTEVGDISSHAITPVILTSIDIRRFVRNLLVGNDVDLPVLSYQDLANEVTVQPLGSITV